MDVYVKNSVSNGKETNADNNIDYKLEKINGLFDDKDIEYKKMEVKIHQSNNILKRLDHI